MEISANQLWKNSKSNLPFKDWINREKAKGEIIPQSGVNNAIEQEILDKVSQKEIIDDKSVPNKKLILGLNPNVLIISALVVLSALTYKYYQKK